MANETTIKIKMTPDGKDYTIELVENDAMSGTRLDQIVAQGIIGFEKMNRDENFQKAWMQFKQQFQAPQYAQMPNQGAMYSGYPQGSPYANPYGAPYPPNVNPYGGWGGGFRR